MGHQLIQKSFMSVLLLFQVMESANSNPGCLIIGADKDKLVMLEENNKYGEI
jgi:hypothetical protein